MGFPHPSREVDCGLCPSCKASTGEIDGMGLFLGQAERPACSLHGSVNAHVYRELLRRWLIPVLEDVRSALGSPHFQQDNAKIHTAKIMLTFFERYAIPRESHPAYSPDLNRSSMPGPYSSDNFSQITPTLATIQATPRR